MRTTPLLLAGLVALAQTPTPAARACSPLPRLTPIAVADPAGPFVFQCHAGCEQVPAMRWVKSGSSTPVPGRWETLSPQYVGSTPLLAFVPAAPVEAGAPYQLLADTLPSGAQGVLGFTVGGGALAEPLAQISVSSAERTQPSGTSFHCDLDFMFTGGTCSAPASWLGWSSEERSIPVVALSLGPRDGFVFRAYRGPHIEGINSTFAPSLRTTFDFAGEAQLCITVDAVDVRTGVLWRREQRRGCRCGRR